MIFCVTPHSSGNPSMLPWGLNQLTLESVGVSLFSIA